MALTALRFVILIPGFLILFGCSRPACDANDEARLRAMFRVPAGARYVAPKSNTQQKTFPGVSGCEGHSSIGTFEFSPEQFAAYWEAAFRRDDWIPVADIGVAPEKDTHVSPLAQFWQTLPLPPYLLGSRRLEPGSRGAEVKHAMRNANEGLFFCTISEMRRDTTPAESRRMSCQEKPDLAGHSFRLGVLDAGSKRLYAVYSLGT